MKIMETLTMTNIRLLDLYKIPIQTTSNETAELFINQEVERRQNIAIKKAWEWIR